MAIFDHFEFTPVFLGKLLEKIWNSHFWLFQIYTSLFGVNCWKKFRMAIPNLYHSFWENLSEKIQNGHFWPFQIYASLFGKNCWTKFGMAICGHSKLYQSFWEKLSEKIWNGHFWPFQIYISHFWKIVGKNLEQPFLVILNFF